MHASLLGGPHGWAPLLYLTYSRVPLGSGRSGVAVARLLLEHGADPNAGYLWEGLIPPFTALTGALGGGGTLPKHEEELPLARLLLQAGADANDGQALYNQGWGPRPGRRTGLSCCSSSAWAPATAARGDGCSASGKTHPGRCSRTC